MDYDVTKQKDPFIGYKIIELDYRRPFWEIQTHLGTSGNHPDGIPVKKAEALCALRADPDGLELMPCSKHSPEEFARCSCGFYALKSYKGVDTGWLAKVQLYGRVIVAEHGYRATKQDILEVWAPEDEYIQKGELLKEQFPGVIWHLKEMVTKDVVSSYPAVIPSATIPPPANTSVNTSDYVEAAKQYDAAARILAQMYAPYDVIPKEILDQFMSGQVWQFQLPILKNASMAIQVRFMTTQSGLYMELLDVNNARIFSVTFTGSRYQWIGPNGERLY